MKRLKLLSVLALLLISFSVQAQNLNKVYAAMEEEDWEVALEMLNPQRRTLAPINPILPYPPPSFKSTPYGIPKP